MGFMLPVILNNKIFAEDKSKLSKEPSETMITPTKFVPRIGDEVSFDINNFGYENQDEKIGSDYGIVFYNYEEINEYDQFAKNNNAMVLQNIDLPNIKVETYGKNEEKWDP